MYTLNWTKVTSHNRVLVDTTLPARSFAWTSWKDVEETFNLEDAEWQGADDRSVNLVYRGEIATDWTKKKTPFTVHTTATERQLLSTGPDRYWTETVHTAYVVTSVEKWEEPDAKRARV
jgi:hypothetical protein